MNNTDENDESQYSLIGSGTWRDFLPSLPKPVIALGHKSIYYVFIHGTRFEVRFGGTNMPLIGFFTTRFVAASNVRQAEQCAFQSVISEWEKEGFLGLSGVEPTLSVEKLEQLSERFRLRSGGGFTFYRADSNDDTRPEGSTPA